MPPNLTALHPINAPFGSINLYALTANYRRSFRQYWRLAFGAYLIGGGGWYCRCASVDKASCSLRHRMSTHLYLVGYGCDTGGFVFSETVASRARALWRQRRQGFTIRLSDSGWKFYVESATTTRGATLFR